MIFLIIIRNCFQQQILQIQIDKTQNLHKNYKKLKDDLYIVGLSGTNPILGVYKDNYTNVKDKLKEAKGLEDGTYDFVTLKPLSFDKGYEVSFETYAKNSENYYSDEEFDNIVFKLSSLFGINANLGVYGGFPQISFYFEDKNMSLAIAALFNQQSVWDWANNNIILNTFHQPKYYY